MKIERKIAMCYGYIKYTAKRKCKNDGCTERYTKTDICVECHKRRSSIQYIKKVHKDKKIITLSIHPNDENEIRKLVDALNSARELKLINS